MMWHFLKCFFWLFLPIVMYVSIFQFSGADFMILDGGNTYIHADVNTTYFGFTSILNFIEDMGNDYYLTTAFKNFSNFFGLLNKMSSLGMSTFLNNVDNAIDDGANFFTIAGLVLTFNVSAIVGILFMPIIVFALIAGMLIYIVIFIFAFITKFNQLLTGGYNVVIPVVESESISESIRILIMSMC